MHFLFIYFLAFLKEFTNLLETGLCQFGKAYKHRHEKDSMLQLKNDEEQFF